MCPAREHYALDAEIPQTPLMMNLPTLPVAPNLPAAPDANPQAAAVAVASAIDAECADDKLPPFFLVTYPEKRKR